MDDDPFAVYGEEEAAPPHDGLGAWSALADGYKQYIKDLKSGESSGISGVFGKPIFTDGDAFIEPKSITPDAKAGAVVEIISGKVSIPEVAQQLGCTQKDVQAWLATALDAISRAFSD